MNLVEALGLDPEHLEWQQLALCRGTDIAWFYDLYESDVEIAKQVDQMCLSCPVIKECGAAGQDGEAGVWGGLYWTNGKPDKTKNSHKSEAVWEAIRKKYS